MSWFSGKGWKYNLYPLQSRIQQRIEAVLCNGKSTVCKTSGRVLRPRFVWEG